MKKKNDNSKDDLVLTRVFDAGRESVWNAWTRPELLRRWWGPKDFTSPECKIDLRVGGRYLFCMQAPDGKRYWSTGTYKQVQPLDMIAFTDSFADEKGNAVPASYYGMEGEWPMEMSVTITFADEGSGTRMTLRHAGIPAGPVRDQTAQGWEQSFDKLALSLKSGGAGPKMAFVAEPGRQTVAITREFDAPRDLVFKAFTDPDQYIQWLGPRRYSMTLETFEPKSGGRWRYIQKDPKGNKFTFHGVYHEVSPPERIIGTFEFEGLAEKGHVLLETARFEEIAGERTALTILDVFLSVADRDGMVASGMERGMSESFDRLDELLAKVRGAIENVMTSPIVHFNVPMDNEMRARGLYEQPFAREFR